MEATKVCDNNILKQEKYELNRYVEETTIRIQAREKMRFVNNNVVWPKEEYFLKLDSSLKKNTAFVKRLRQFTANHLENFLKDIDALNLSKYISEVSSAISEAKIKLADIPSCITLCHRLHMIYSEFSVRFLENWRKNLNIRVNEKISNPSKLRVDLRFFAELLCNGIFPIKSGLTVLGSAIVGIINHDKNDHSNISIIISFCKHCGEEYAGLQSTQMLSLAQKYNMELPKSTFLPTEKQQNLRYLLKDYYATLIKHLKLEHKELQNAERNKKRLIEVRGEYASEKREQLEILQANFEKLLNATQILSDLLGEHIPELHIEIENVTDASSIINVVNDCSNTPFDTWGDQETKIFYTELPDLRSILPNYCPPKEMIINTEQVTEEALDADDESVLEDIIQECSNQTEQLCESLTDETQFLQESSSSTCLNLVHTTQNKQSFEAFLQNLVNCVNKESADSAAVDFLLNFNNKPNRRKLVRILYGVHRTRLDLLPMYSRILKIVAEVSPDIAVDICQLLKNDFKYQVAKRDQINIESKIKVVRFIGELVKFELYTKLEALMCLKILLYNFQHHQIEMACALLEVCGLYLYNCRDSRARTLACLEKMMRFKIVKSLDSRHSAQVENCYFLIKPEFSTPVKKEKPTLHKYIRYLLYEELNKQHVENVIHLLRRIDYNNSMVFTETVKYLTKAHKIRYNSIKYLADVLSALYNYQENIVIQVIDNVLEDIRAGLEIHSPKLAQRRIAMITYLGEIYNYRLVEANDIINTLYLIVSIGVSFDHENYSDVDPPQSMFRLKLVCVLLNTCGMYFTKQSHKKRLDYFIVFLQQYYWFKKSSPIFNSEQSHEIFPLLMDHMYKECISSLRPKIIFFKSFEESNVAVNRLKDLLYPDLDSFLLGNNKSDVGLITIVDSDGDCTDEISNENEEESGSELNKESSLSEESGNRITDTLLTNKRDERILDDLEFDRMFEKIAQDSHQERLKEIKLPLKEISIPNAMKSLKKSYEQLKITDTKECKDCIGFTLMIRGSRSGKQQLKTFKAPISSYLAQNLIKQKEVIRKEDERVKHLTLNISERIEEEDYYQESLHHNKPVLPNKLRFNRQQKFKHQKGVPDADTIFL